MFDQVSIVILKWQYRSALIPLHIASQYGHISIVVYLIKCGAKVDVANKNVLSVLNVLVL